MQISSPVFDNNTSIPVKYTCDGQDINPPLIISGILENAESLVLIMDDPDSPSGNFLHWIVWNIPPLITQILENSKVEGAVEGKNDFGKIGYGGPCPHQGEHHYHFRLFAIDQKLSLENGATREDVEKALEGHIIESCELIGLYKRQ